MALSRGGLGFWLFAASALVVSAVWTDRSGDLTLRADAGHERRTTQPPAVGQARQPSPVTSRGVQRKRILYMEGAPRPEMKFLRRALDNVADLQLVTLQRTKDNKYLRFNGEGPDDLRDGFPRTTEELFAYRGLILGPIEASAFTSEQHQMIADFVGVRGGGLLVLGGGQSLGEGGWVGTPLAHVLPIIIESKGRRQAPELVDHLIVKPSAEGVNHPAIRIADTEAGAARLWLEMPQVSTVNAVSEKPGATTLLNAVDESGRERIVLAIQSQGRGKSAVFTIQDSWRWQMAPKAPPLAHERFWRSLLAWLVDGVPE